MKKVFLILISFIFLLIVMFGVFLATFDANHYKSALTANLEKILEKPVSIGKIGLKWQDGIALEIVKLQVFPEADTKAAAGIQLESAAARIQLLSLLRKKIQITSIAVMGPYAEIVRHADGAVTIGGIDLSKKGPPSSLSPGSGTNAGLSSVDFLLTIGSLVVKDGHFLFRDLSGVKPSTIEIKDLDVHVKNFSLTRPFTFEAQAAVFSDKQNIKVTGTALLPRDTASVTALDHVTVAADLENFDIQKIAKAFPDFGKASTLEKVQGNFAAELDHLELSAQWLDQAKGKITLKNGKVVLGAVNSPIDNIDAASALEKGQVRIDHLTAGFGGGTLEFSGRASGFNTQPVLDIKGSVKDLPLDRLIKNLNPQAPHLNGHLTLAIEGRAQGLVWEKISRTLNGRARILIPDGVLLNYNILREVMDKISVIPGAAEAIQANFPQVYRMRLEDRSTLLKPVDLNANITNGTFLFDPLRVDTDLILIDGAGRAGLDRSLDVHANLIVDQGISQACVRALNLLQSLCNNRGEMVVPVDIRGNVPQVKIVPDKQYITSKLLSGKTQEVVQQLVSDPAGGIDKIQDILKKNLKGLKI